MVIVLILATLTVVSTVPMNVWLPMLSTVALIPELCFWKTMEVQALPVAIGNRIASVRQPPVS